MFDLIIEGLFGTVSATVFTISIIFLFLFSCLVLPFEDKREWVFSKAPALMTTLGLFGTFCGVAIGLGKFDVSNIDQSVINLIAGMKLAFWTSILGMLGGFTLHMLQYVIGCFSGSEGEGEEIDILCDIYDILQKQSENKDSLLIKEIQDFESTYTQSNEKLLKEFQSLRIAFNSFTDKMADNNSKALIEALEKVMRDFNTKINEQFGDNFKHLNQAVGNLLEWQEKYRIHLEALTEQFKIAQNGIEASRKEIEKITSNLNDIPMILSKLQNVIIAMDKETKESGETLKAFIALRNQASDVFPTIKNGIDDLTINIKHSVDDFRKSTEEQNNTIKKLGEAIVYITGNVQTALKQGADQVQSVFRDAVDKMKQSTLDSFATFDKESEQSLNRIIQLMSNNLASIHQKLISDCQEITERIKFLANASRGI